MSSRGICFIALNGYPALVGRAGREHVGGAELQMALLAREMARRGRPVSFITLDAGQPDGEEIDGVVVRTAYRARAGLPALRFVHPRFTGLWSAMARADADVYYQRMAEQTTGLAAAFCNRRGRRLVFAAASDYDCMASLPRLHKLRERWLFRYGLRRADLVLAQTENQCRLLKEGFGVGARVLPNAAQDWAGRADAASRAGTASVHRPRVLWVGRFTPEKRVGWVFEMARRCPEARFDVIGDGPAAAMREAQTGVKDLGNVRLLGRVAHDRLAEHYSGAHALLCTSEREGFPNTFLEAWCFGVPVVTSFDPDGVVTREGLGAAADDLESLVIALGAVTSTPGAWEQAGRRCRRYFELRHRVSCVVDQLEGLVFDAGEARQGVLHG